MARTEFVMSRGKTTLTVKSRTVGLMPIAPQMLAGMEAG